ncbi:hypothetical protein [Ruminococcus sp.]|uniref:hypothetical protein n=1 Tax=Ruminococcus sp. TaxID=41978 RepID=UPI0025DF92C6|nr:hypothetical protein [Ruminococcus sp.]
MRIRDRISKLIDVKTFITFSITGLFIYLGAQQIISADKVWEAFLIIVVFYFGTQNGKKSNDNIKESEKE